MQYYHINVLFGTAYHWFIITKYDDIPTGKQSLRCSSLGDFKIFAIENYDCEYETKKKML